MKFYIKYIFHFYLTAMRQWKDLNLDIWAEILVLCFLIHFYYSIFDRKVEIFRIQLRFVNLHFKHGVLSQRARRVVTYFEERGHRTLAVYAMTMKWRRFWKYFLTSWGTKKLNGEKVKVWTFRDGRVGLKYNINLQ